ncbi:cation-translocating P-type ATPase [Shewanella sp. CAL98-MNA-CIBAN-0140]|uniref:cation-translocating P-type ATPase n=1 Tax=unclassified Shewanella TaxID=196818 RepID=UPI003317F92A
MSSVKWHSLPFADVLQRLNSSLTGLTTEQAKKRLIEYGHNAIIQKRRRSLLYILLGQFSDFMIIVLLVAAVISGFIGEPQDTIAILVIVLLNAVIGTVQEFKAERAVAALRKMAAPEAYVLRDGHQVTLGATELVPGDVVILEAGNIVPADLRLLEEEELLVDESTLTGESHAIEKQTEPLADTALAIGDRVNLVFKSSMITRGRGKGVVVASGMETEIGQIAGLLQDEASVKTPLQTRLSRFGRYLALAVLAICVVVFAAGLLQGQPILLMFLTSVSLGVAAIPEALPAVVTISLALGARNLIRHNVLVRNLPAVETLGSVTYICTDKTGTLTQNLMTVELFFAAGEQRGSLPEPEASIPWAELGQAMALNNDIMEKDGKPAGEPTELALFEAAHMAGFDKSILELTTPRIAVIAFDSERKQMTTLHQTADLVTAYIKGAPEQVLQQCIQGLNNDGVTAFEVAAVLAEAAQLANKGYRVLAFAKREFSCLPESVDAETVERELTFLGLVALIDPPRPEVPQAVNDCLTAGIIPVMITGDHPGTAMAIAQRLGIIDDDRKVLSGDQLAKIPDEEFSRLVDSIRVYARVTPEQKLRIVKALQDKGEFVAMTGDGVNDAPALKRASIGVAMGLKGTDVAREASDMVLLDDDFSSIVRAIRSGRRTFDNIRKFIKYTLSSNAGEILTLFLAPFFGLPIPLLPIHILWINLVTDGLPGLALTTEPAEPDIMNRAPCPPKESIFSHGMWQHILWVGLFIGGISIATMAWAISRDVVYWQTMVFTVLTVSQLFHSLAVRSESTSFLRIGLFSNLPMLGSFLLTLLLQMVVIYTPALNTIFHTQPLPMVDLAVCLFISSLILFAVEIEKWLMHRGVIYA